MSEIDTEKLDEAEMILIATRIDHEGFEERAAILEFEGRMSRAEAEKTAARAICVTRLKK